MNRLRSAAGVFQIEITSADKAAVLQRIVDNNIVLHDVLEVDDLTVSAGIARKDFPLVENVVKAHGGKTRVLGLYGFFWRIAALRRHPVLLACVGLLLLFAACLPGRIFFVNVEGNMGIPDKLILEKAEECGIRFGASRKLIRSEKMKNSLLSSIPELQWAGVNTSGCVATICVREKSAGDDVETADNAVGSIVASRDGVVVSTTVISGNLLCKVGDAVTAGQTLVSGYTDCGITIQATCADAEILAQTNRTICMISPLLKEKRTRMTDSKTLYSMKVGKKLIKFYKDSGISGDTCVKMYSEEYVTLPGGFILPLALVKEELFFYETVSCTGEELNWLQSASREYLQTQMAAGQILRETTELSTDGDVCSLNGAYACLEMIGQVKYEELMYDYGKEH